jgi:hypothetical protein
VISVNVAGRAVRSVLDSGFGRENDPEICQVTRRVLETSEPSRLGAGVVFRLWLPRGLAEALESAMRTQGAAFMDGDSESRAEGRVLIAAADRLRIDLTTT